MRDGAEDMEHELSGGGCRVDPFLEADQVYASCLEVIDRFEELFERAAGAFRPFRVLGRRSCRRRGPTPTRPERRCGTTGWRRPPGCTNGCLGEVPEYRSARGRRHALARVPAVAVAARPAARHGRQGHPRRPAADR